MEGRIRETMHDAFWEHLKERLSATPPDFNCALELLKEIKEVSGKPYLCRYKVSGQLPLTGMSVASKSQLNMVYESVRV